MGSRSSSQANQTITNIDRRQALQDSIGISGDGSSITTNTSNYADNSFKQTTNVNDSSVRNTTTNITDGGAIAGAFDTAKAISGMMLQGQNKIIDANSKLGDNALEFATKQANNAFELVGKNEHFTADLLKKNADLAQLAVGKVGEAWQTAKVAESGKTLGDFKYIVFGLIGVFALLAYKRG